MPPKTRGQAGAGAGLEAWAQAAGRRPPLGEGLLPRWAFLLSSGFCSIQKVTGVLVSGQSVDLYEVYTLSRDRI